MTHHCDVAIIGAGTAGMAAYRAAGVHSDKVLLIESARYGTTCARVGCMPSKLLIAAGDAAQAVRGAYRFGVQSDAPRIDGRAVMERVRSERDRFVGFVLDTVHGWPEATRLMGRARFVTANTLDVDGQRIAARSVVIATGSRPRIPTGWRERLGDRLLVNDDVFDWTDLPKSLAVVGAGVIGLELAQALHHLGVNVRLFSRGNRIGPLTDPELQALARRLFAETMPLTLNAAALEPALDGRQVVIGGERFDALLCATGREPQLDDLGLEALNLPRDAGGDPILDRQTGQWGDHPLFIAGDATNDLPLLHEATDTGRIAGDNAARWPRCASTPAPRAAGHRLLQPADRHCRCQPCRIDRCGLRFRHWPRQLCRPGPQSRHGRQPGQPACLCRARQRPAAGRGDDRPRCGAPRPPARLERCSAATRCSRC